MDIGEVLGNPGFYILNAVGFVAVLVMLFTLKSMGNGDLMSMWVKIATLISIPIASFIFTLLFGE